MSGLVVFGYCLVFSYWCLLRLVSFTAPVIRYCCYCRYFPPPSSSSSSYSASCPPPPMTTPTFISIYHHHCYHWTNYLRDALLPCVRYNIFDEAIAEVLHVMEVNFKADFERTMEFRSLSKAVEREARELQVLRQVKTIYIIAASKP